MYLNVPIYLPTMTTLKIGGYLKSTELKDLIATSLKRQLTPKHNQHNKAFMLVTTASLYEHRFIRVILGTERKFYLLSCDYNTSKYITPL